MVSDPDGIDVDAQFVVTKKGTPTAPAFKACLVAREFAAGNKRDDLFTRMPGTNTLRYAVSQAATWHWAKRLVIVVLDIHSAFLYEETGRFIWSFPEKIATGGNPEMVGILNKALPGTRAVPQQ